MPYASIIINLSMPIKALRAAGRCRPGSQRPPSPFELIENKGKLMNMKKMWSNMYPMFAKCVGKIENPHIIQHAERGMVGTYLGTVDTHSNVEQYGHYMLRHSDKKVIKVRSVIISPGVYPMRQEPQRALKQLASDSGGEKKDTEPDQAKSKKDKIKPPEKFSKGTIAMTVIGPCIVLDRYDDGDYRVTFPEGCEPQEVLSIKAKDLWLTSDYPDWQYGPDGTRLGAELEHKKTKRMHIITNIEPVVGNLNNMSSNHLDSMDSIKIDEDLYSDNSEEEKHPPPAPAAA